MSEEKLNHLFLRWQSEPLLPTDVDFRRNLDVIHYKIEEELQRSSSASIIPLRKRIV